MRSATKTARKAPTTNNNNNFWKILLIFTAIAVFNVIYLSQDVLVAPNNSKQDILLSSWSIAVQNATNQISFGNIAMEEGNGPKNDKIPEIGATEMRHETRNNANDVKENHQSITQDHNSSNERIPNSSTLDHATIEEREIDEKARKGVVVKVKEDIRIDYIPRHKPNEHMKYKRQQRQMNKEKDRNRTLSPEEMLKFTYEETAMMPNVSNALYYKDIPPEFLVEDPAKFIWDRPDAMIPEWMKDYFRWHRWKRSTWKDQMASPILSNSTNETADDWWKSERWMISQCLMSQDRKKCGGTADRLKPIPTLIRLAYEYKRILLIRWTRPAPLEEFLLPPAGGFDWRVPQCMVDVIENPDNGKRLTTYKSIVNYLVGGMTLIRVRFQHSTPGQIYDDMVFKGTPKDDDKYQFGFEAVFSRVWKVVFTPALPIQAILKSSLTNFGLVPNQYVASHLRALYAVDTRETELIQRFTENALACATQIFPGVPIFFASDSMVALQHARESNEKEIHEDAFSTKLRVVTASETITPPASPESNEIGSNSSASTSVSEPWHLDSFLGPVEKFYDTFVDLYLLGMAGCVTYNKGGYGHWGMLIGGHSQCQMRQALIGHKIRNKTAAFCKFRVASGDNKNTVASFNKRHPSAFGRDDIETGPLFLPPME